jgi:hypothetical protein
MWGKGVQAGVAWNKFWKAEGADKKIRKIFKKVLQIAKNGLVLQPVSIHTETSSKGCNQEFFVLF